MQEELGKNTLIVNILNVLKYNTDEDHKISQHEIIEYVKKDYGMDVERKSINRIIDNLIDLGYDINFDETPRGKSVVRSNYYFSHEFDDSELKFLIDGILFSRLISKSQKNNLIKKLQGLSSKYFSNNANSIGKIKTVQTEVCDNQELFLNIEIIAEAIAKKKVIKFNYCEYDINKKVKFRQKDGKAKIYEVEPYEMVATNGRYYLMCYYSEYGEISNFRVDRIRNVEILDKYIDSKINEKFVNFDLPRHMLEHIYMMNGESIIVKFDFKKGILNDVIDWFGKDIMITDKGDVYEASVKVNKNAMKFWAMQYGEQVTVTYPKELIKDIKSILKNMTDNYK